jgi:Ca2+-binding RTX toxin-like protein
MPVRTTPRGILVAAAALVALLAIPLGAAVADGAGATTSHTLIVRDGEAQAAAEAHRALVLEPSAASTQIHASYDSSRNLVLTSPQGLEPPKQANGTDDPKCPSDGLEGFHCEAGYIVAIVGGLGAGQDTFTATSDLAVLIGGVVNGKLRALSGGADKDTLVGGAAGDALAGSDANDLLKGGRGRDVLSGGDGRDLLKGGSARDLLRGNGGRDWLDGGGGTDTCRGGASMDLFRSCETASQ